MNILHAYLKIYSQKKKKILLGKICLKDSLTKKTNDIESDYFIVNLTYLPYLFIIIIINRQMHAQTNG